MFQVPASGTWIFRCQVLFARWHETWASGVSLKIVYKMQFRDACSRSIVYSSQKLWHQLDEGNFTPCILSYEIGGYQNLMEEPYLSKTPFLTFVYLSTCNTKLPGIFGNSKKNVFMNWSSANAVTRATGKKESINYSKCQINLFKPTSYD